MIFHMSPFRRIQISFEGKQEKGKELVQMRVMMTFKKDVIGSYGVAKVEIPSSFIITSNFNKLCESIS